MRRLKYLYIYCLCLPKTGNAAIDSLNTVVQRANMLTWFDHFTLSRLWKETKISPTYSSETQTDLRHFLCYCFEWHSSSPVKAGSLLFSQTGLDTQVLTH